VGKKNGDEKKQQQPEVLKTITEALPVALTDKQRLEIGLELARAEGEIADHDTRSSEVKQGLKAKEAEIRARISQLSTSLRNGQKFQDVQVDIVADFESNRARYVRQDTGEEVRNRALDASERQGLLLPEDEGELEEAELPSGVSRAEE